MANQPKGQGAVKGCYLNKEDLREVEKSAKEHGVTVSSWIKEAIMDRLGEEEHERRRQEDIKEFNKLRTENEKRRAKK